MGEVVIRGQIMTLDTREIRGEKTIIIMSVTDFTDSIVLKIFTKNENLPELMGDLKKGAFLKIKGVTTIDKFDSELTIGSIVGIKKIPDFTTIRMDNSPLKRVELHCHTKMSDMDGVTDVGDLVKGHISGDIRHWRLPIMEMSRHSRLQTMHCRMTRTLRLSMVWKLILWMT